MNASARVSELLQRSHRVTTSAPRRRPGARDRQRRVDGEPLSDVDTASYYVMIATAGHDTTSATIAGGLEVLIENP